MPSIPIISGVLASNQAQFNQSLPINLEPVLIDSKISKGQLRATAGAIGFATGPGIDRGGVFWNGVAYRVMGTKFVSVSAELVTIIGDVGGFGPVQFDNSFDRLGIASDGLFFYYDGISLTQVTDPDLGTVVDFIWINGYFMTTDGTSLVVAELSDPTAVDPLKYGSSETDPDPVTGLEEVRDEVYAINRYTVDVFRNVGGNGFPFTLVKGATIPYGGVSASAKCGFDESFAFVGSAKEEALGVYIAGNGTAEKISSRLVDDYLAADPNPAGIICENRSSKDEKRLFLHLSDKTLVYLRSASRKVGEPVWYVAQSQGAPYRIRGAVECGGKFMVADLQTGALGWLLDDVSTHFGQDAGWRFDAGLIYNDGQSAILNAIDLIGLPWRGGNSTIFMSITSDGQNFGPERPLKITSRFTRMQWRPHMRIRQYAGLRFRGNDSSMPGFAACNVTAEPLAV